MSNPEVPADNDFNPYRESSIILGAATMQKLVTCEGMLRDQTISKEAATWMAYDVPDADDWAVISNLGIKNAVAARNAEVVSNIKLTPKRVSAPQGVTAAGMRVSARRFEQNGGRRSMPAMPPSRGQQMRSDYNLTLGRGWLWNTANTPAQPEYRYEFFLNPQIGHTLEVFNAVRYAVERSSIQVGAFVLPRIAAAESRQPQKKPIPQVGIILRTSQQHGRQLHNIVASTAQQYSEYFVNRKNVKCTQKISDGVSMGEEAGPYYGFIDSRAQLISRTASRTRKSLGIMRHGAPATEEQLGQIPEVFAEHWAAYAKSHQVDPQNIAWLSQ